MERRVFLGWDRPFVGLAAEWLLARGEDLTDTLVLVPSSQSGRQLRHQMASRAGALLSPLIRTPGSLMTPEASSLAPDWFERLAWQEILEHPSHRSLIESLFETEAELEGAWAGSLAEELLQLRRRLQENGLLLHDAAQRLGSSPDDHRWRALSSLESRLEARLQRAGRKSRSRCLADGLTLPRGIRHLVMAGITELPPILERCLLSEAPDLQILVAAPEDMAQHFNEGGIPLNTWSEQAIPWPDSKGEVHVAVDDRHQAQIARQAAAAQSTPVAQVALGTADPDAGDALAREFSRSGWTAHHPASPTPRAGLRRWLGGWSQWLVDPSLVNAGELLALPETSTLIEAERAAIANSLAELRDRWMVQRPEDLRHQLREGSQTRGRKQAYEVLKAIESLEQWRKRCLGSQLPEVMRQLLETLVAGNEATAAQADEVHAWLNEADETIKDSRRPLAWWIELMLQDLPPRSSPPPDGRVLDVQGWLELLYEPGKHLILCGVNEGRLPSSDIGDPWLGEAARTLLGLRTDANRAARDAYLLSALCRARLESGGRVDLVCSRSNGRGEPMMPSRLLLAADREQLPDRIRRLFRELEPPDARLRWQADHHWKTPAKSPGDHLNATAFSDYLACPYRYYLKHVLRMHGSEPDRVEWNARDFGNIIHQVLECWGRDDQARQSDQADEIHAWICRQLDTEVTAAFGERLPLAVRIQVGSVRQRLRWFADIQAAHRAAGWAVHEVEHAFKIPLGETAIQAKIDRIDRHQETGELLVIDYKTGGKDKTAVSAHRTQWRANSSLPEHIGEQDPVLYERDDGKGGTKTWRWQNLQLPLYALAIHERHGQLPTPCYFKLGETETEVMLQPWQDFDESDLEAARSCAEWVAERIAQGVFWPPAEKPRYDDYELLWCGRPPGEVLDPLVESP